MDDTQTNRFAPPGTYVQDVEATDGLQLATRGQRLGAALIDGLFALALSLAVMLPMYGTEYFSLIKLGKLGVLKGMLVYMAIFWAVEGWFLYQRSQSLGKMALGLRIVRMDGSTATFGRSFGLRLAAFGAAGWIPYVGPLLGWVDALFIFGSSRRCLHDYVADTIVVTASSSPAAYRTAGAAAA